MSVSSGHARPSISSSTASPLVAPLIPERFIDIPSQRLYALSFALLVQVGCPLSTLVVFVYLSNLKGIKIFDFLQYLLSSEGSPTPHYGKKWLLVDLLFCVILSRLRIPRLNYANSVVVLQILGLALVDGLLFGGIRLHIFGDSSSHPSRDGTLVTAHSCSPLVTTFQVISDFTLPQTCSAYPLSFRFLPSAL